MKEVLEKLLPLVEHRDGEYVGDHWAAGECPRCIVEIALGLRDPRAGGRTLEENRRLLAQPHRNAPRSSR